MQAVPPNVEVPGDNETTPEDKPWLRPHIMHRAGDCVGMTEEEAVWRFGFNPDSEAAEAYGVCIPYDRDVVGNSPATIWPGFVWVLATRKSGKVRETFIGFATELPASFKKVIDG